MACRTSCSSYLEGTLLTDEIYRVRGFPIRRALRIARQIASALGAAHATGIIHRDLKTDNVFLIDREQAADHVKVLDFGVSRFMDTENEQSRNRDLVVGTPQFMAPEQITTPDKVDQRADIYALGVILYEMLTASRPFTATSDQVLFQQILTEAPPPLDLPALARGFEEMLLGKFLAKQPEDRFQSMKEVETALETYAGMVRPTLDSTPIARIDEVVPAVPLPRAASVVSLPTPPRRPRHAWLVLALASVGAGIALVVVRGRAPAIIPPNTASLQADAERIWRGDRRGDAAAELRADGFAQSPKLRAAVETDAATVKDMLRNDFVLNQARARHSSCRSARTASHAAARRPEGQPLAFPEQHAPRLHASTSARSSRVARATRRQDRRRDGAVATGRPRRRFARDREHAATRDRRGAARAARPIPLGGHRGGGPRGPPGRRDARARRFPDARRDPAPDPRRADQRLPTGQLRAWAGGGLFAMLYAGSLIRARRRG